MVLRSFQFCIVLHRVGKIQEPFSFGDDGDDDDGKDESMMMMMTRIGLPLAMPSNSPQHGVPGWV
jgi:hypothetical protein